MTYRNVLLFGTALSALSPLLPAAADAQASPSAFTAGMRYDAARRVTGTISPDPDGAGPLPFRAVRNTYDAAGRLIRAERGTLSAWQSETVAPVNWSGFTIFETVQSFYDNGNRKVRDIASGGGTVYTVTDYSYDTLGRPRCTAVRMNPAIFPSATGVGGSLPADACTPGTASITYGPDRITRTSRNWRGDVTRQETGVGTTQRRDVATYNYTLDGQVQTITDANGNMSAFNYDGHDRMNYMFFPSPTVPGEANASDYEQYTLDANGNRTSVRRRDGQVINYTYDALNRMTSKDPPGSEPTVTYSYDLLGRITAAATPAYPSMGLTFAYDALGRRTGETGPLGTLAFQYDGAGNRTRITYPNADYTTYVYNIAGELTALRESDNDQVATLTYDTLGRRTSVSYLGGSGTTYGYDGVSRLASLSHNLGGTANDVNVTFARNPAGQIVTRTASNTAYSFTPTAASVSDTHNGLNQITSTGGSAVAHDARGNATAIGVSAYGYDSENRLISAPGGVALAYDPLGRLYQTTGPSGTRRFQYEGDRLVGEHDGAGALVSRYVHGSGTDEVLLAYALSRRYLHADERGSIVAVSDGAGNIIGTPVRYDEYGNPQGTMPTRFGYTGQAWVSEIGMWYYKARIFNSALGRFMQSDPSGYADGPNIYAYVGGDPVNATDPSGEDRVTCNIVDGSFRGCTLLPDDRNVTNVTYRETVHYTDAYGNEHSYVRTTNQTLSGSISQEGIISRALFGVGSSILRSISANVSAMTDSNIRLVIGSPASSQVSSTNGVPSLGNSPQFRDRRSDQSGREAASNVPSWARGERPHVGENGRQFAERLMNQRYGQGGWSARGPGSEFSQIKKFGDRGFE